MMKIKEEVVHKTRLSNYELLRIVAMLLVMFGHSLLRLHLYYGSDIPLMAFIQSLSACVSTWALASILQYLDGLALGSR